MFPLSAACILGQNGAQMYYARRHTSGIHSQASEGSELIPSGDIICEVASCGDKQDRYQTTYAARKHSGKLMIQGEQIVRRSMVESLATGVDHWQSLKLGRHHRDTGRTLLDVIASENTFLSTTSPRQSFGALRGALQDLART